MIALTGSVEIVYHSGFDLKYLNINMAEAYLLDWIKD